MVALVVLFYWIVELVDTDLFCFLMTRETFLAAEMSLTISSGCSSGDPIAGRGMVFGTLTGPYSICSHLDLSVTPLYYLRAGTFGGGLAGFFDDVLTAVLVTLLRLITDEVVLLSPFSTEAI